MTWCAPRLVMSSAAVGEAVARTPSVKGRRRGVVGRETVTHGGVYIWNASATGYARSSRAE